ncbi:MAG: T9SS type A sorting domain-containing protein [Ignavibacteriales bacterium]|nr:T9SS type A sorting domain-containing protein [Ignavibacteriales bacterium]
MKKLFTIWALLTILLLIVFLNTISFGQLSSPTTETVYGGRINGISAISTGGTSSRIFIATESANSVFYANVTTTSGSESFGSFTVMPGLGNDDGYGSGISKIYAHQASQYLFFLQNNTLYKTIYSGSAVTMVEAAAISDFIIYGDYIFYIKGSDLYYGQLNASGDVVVGSTGTIAIGTTPTSPSLRVNPFNNKVYIAALTTTPTMYKTSNNYNSLSGSTISTVTLGALSGSVTSWDAFGIGPDGTLFLGGDDNSNKYVQYSTDDGTNWSGGVTTLNGIGGPNFAFGGSSSPYTVHFSKGYATFTTASGFGSWAEYGNLGFETHPNDGAVIVDPNNSQIVYLTTDQGIGATKNGGPNIFGIDTGVEAVQVNDFSMNTAKDKAWLASKAGIRKVTSYSTTPVWSSAMFPNGDGSPYYSAEMENENDATAYVGNLRIYKTTDSGSNWTQVLSEATTGYASVGTRAEAIEVCPTNSSLVVAGFYVDGSNNGGFWYSTDSGASWNQQRLVAVSGTSDVDVYDIEFTTESGNPVAYIGVEYDATANARSVYRAEYSGGIWTTRQDFAGTYTSTGSVIVAQIMDLLKTGNYVYACGTDAGSNHPILYYRDYTADYTTSAGKWTPMTTTGFPTSQVGKAVAVGGGVVYCAVGNIIYTIPETSGTTWSSGYTYPTGTEINVLFYDALLAGTGTGLYGHDYTGALPVELTSFTAGVKGNKVTLNWETATEVNSYGFNVERRVKLVSHNANQSGKGEWKKITFIQGHGNSNSPKTYSFVDEPTGGNEFTYRLKQIDFDGTFEYSPEVNVRFSDNRNFKLVQNFPNPFNPETVIKFELPQASFVKLRVYNTLGEEVGNLINEKKDAGIYAVDFNAKHLPSGVYLYRLETNGYTQTKKMLLVK